MERLLKAAQARKLDRVAAAYAVAGWLLVQAAAISLPTFDAPSWVLRAVLILVLAGFPIALIIGWYLVPRPQLSASLAAVTRTDKMYAAVLGIVSLISLGEFVFILTRAPAQNDSTASVPSEMSIAVLPFVNMSGDARKEYFSDGISEELLNNLANTPVLHVASRTSSFAFKGRNDSIQDIARALNVRSVLEGSVREAGNRVRITAQLINAADGYHLWSETYDRDLTDILAVQTEIATAITSALTRKLGVVPTPTHTSDSIDPEAYRLYLQAKELKNRGNEDDLTKAVDLLRQAIARAPTYAAAYGTLASALRTLVERYNKTALLDSAEIAARQAINLDPGNLSALNTLTTMLLDRWQWAQALEMFRKMQMTSPNDPDVLHQKSIIAYIFNYPETDLAAEKKAAELDPLRPGLHYNLALWYWNEKRYDEAAEAIHRVRQLRQGKFTDADMECLIETGRRHFDEARRIRDSISSYYAESPQNEMSCPFALAVAEGRIPDARKMLKLAAADAEKNGGSFINLADNYRMIGDLKAAIPWYERAYEARDTLIFFAPYEKYQTAELLSYPSWKALWARQPVKEWEAARLKAGKILGVAN